MPKITLRNSFHNREVNVIVPQLREDCGVLFADLSQRQTDKARRKLCPWKACKCSDSPAGIVGIQTHDERTVVVLCPDQEPS